MEKTLKYIIWAGLAGICFIPLIIKANYFFPYIVPKTLTFRIIVEGIFLAFLGLAIIKKEYRPKLNLVSVLFFLYIITVTASSFLADTFYFSFWSNNERSEGLFLLLHLFLFLIILNGFLHGLKNWLILFDFSFLSSLLVSLIGLGQYLGIDWVISSSAGARITSTIGNAGYVAGYLIFNIFFGLFLFFFRKNKWIRFYYILGILLQIFIVFNTLTRGGIIALAFSLVVFLIYLIFFRLRENKIVRNGGIAALLLAVLFTSLVFINKDSGWVQKNDILERVTSISLDTPTALNRLVTWQGAFEGFKEKPLLGYGYENFYQVFDKYFNPKIYRHAGSVVWFDRAHNIIFDRLITGGLIGLLLYLGILFAPLIYLWKHFYKNKSINGYIISIIFSLIMLAYFIQNLFIFEALVTYIPLFITLSFLSQFCPSWQGKFSQSKKPYLVLLTIGIILFFPLFLSFNVKLASANKGLIQAMISDKKQEYKKAYDKFVEIIDMNTANNQEYRQHFGELVIKLLNKENGLDQKFKKQAVLKAEEEFNKQIQEKPLSARNYPMFTRFLNRTYQFDVRHLEKSLELGLRAIELSPTRPQLYYEVAYTQIYLGKYYRSLGKTEETERFFDQAVANMQKAIDLQDQVIESYVNMVMVLFTVGQNEKVQSYLDRMGELELYYRRPNVLERMANSAIHAKDYEWTNKFYQEIVAIDPNKPSYWVNLALSYAHLDQKEKAVETAEKIKEFGGEYTAQSEAFIQDVLDGKYAK
jgi:O-antigen ligase